MAVIGGLLIELSANVARLADDLGKAQRHVQATERMISQSVRNANAVFGTLGVTLSAGAVMAYGKHMIDAADATNDLAQRTGHTVEEIVGLQHAAMQSATDVDKLAGASNKLGNALTDKPQLFKRLGIDATTGMDAMVQLADVFKDMPDGIQKNALAAKLLGDKLGAEMIPFLNQGTNAIRELIAEGQRLNPLTTRQAEEAARLNDQMDKMSFQMRGAGMQMMSSVIPGLTETAERMQTLSKEGSPVLALWRGLAGMGKVPWDLLMPPQNLRQELSSVGQIKEKMEQLVATQERINSLERQEKGGWGENKTARIRAELEQARKDLIMLQNQIATLEKHGKELDKPAEKPRSNKPGSGIEDLLGGGGKSILHDSMVAAWEKERSSLFTKGRSMDELAVERSAYEESLQAAQVYHELMNTDAASYAQMRELIEADHQAKLVALAQQGKLSREQLDKLEAASKIRVYTGVMKDIIGAGAEHSRALFNINKVAALSNAAVNLPDAVSSAYKHGSMMGGPILGAVFGGIAFSAQMSQLNAIRSASFGGSGGGSAASGGGGTSSISLPGQVANPTQVPAVAAATPQPAAAVREVNITIKGKVFDAATIRDELIPAFNEAAGDGVRINVVTA